MSSDASVQTGYTHIVRTPEILGGEPRIQGHRIRVRDVVMARDLGGLSPEEISASVYPQLTLGQVYAALAYYEDHHDDIDRAAENESEFVGEFARDHPDLVKDVRPAGS